MQGAARREEASEKGVPEPKSVSYSQTFLLLSSPIFFSFEIYLFTFPEPVYVNAHVSAVNDEFRISPLFLRYRVKSSQNHCYKAVQVEIGEESVNVSSSRNFFLLYSEKLS